MLIPLAFVVVFGATLPLPGVPIPVGALIASLTASYPFQADERGLLDTLYATAPVHRRAVVFGRYVSVLVFAAVAIGIGTATTLVLAALRHESIGWPTLALMLLIAFGILAVALAVQLPWFFALGYTTGRPMIYIPVALISVLGFIAGEAGLLNGTTVIAAVAPSPATALLVLLGGAALLAASAFTASLLYQRREL
jgi:ABC-type transport system involved in multi-copper enzyme maturation permease subunit